jgi:hypothetical protein
MKGATALALAALALLASGPLAPAERTITIALCSGGAIDVPVGDGERDDRRDCAKTACHAAPPRAI